eukprot:scaffold11465_cov105-Isochrysis_galbana.AAC.5
MLESGRARALAPSPGVGTAGRPRAGLGRASMWSLSRRRRIWSRAHPCAGSSKPSRFPWAWPPVCPGPPPCSTASTGVLPPTRPCPASTSFRSPEARRAHAQETLRRGLHHSHRRPAPYHATRAAALGGRRRRWRVRALPPQLDSSGERDHRCRRHRRRRRPPWPKPPRRLRWPWRCVARRSSLRQAHPRRSDPSPAQTGAARHPQPGRACRPEATSSTLPSRQHRRRWRAAGEAWEHRTTSSTRAPGRSSAAEARSHRRLPDEDPHPPPPPPLPPPPPCVRRRPSDMPRHPPRPPPLPPWPRRPRAGASPRRTRAWAPSPHPPARSHATERRPPRPSPSPAPPSPPPPPWPPLRPLPTAQPRCRPRRAGAGAQRPRRGPAARPASSALARHSDSSEDRRVGSGTCSKTRASPASSIDSSADTPDAPSGWADTSSPTAAAAATAAAESRQNAGSGGGAAPGDTGRWPSRGGTGQAQQVRAVKRDMARPRPRLPPQHRRRAAQHTFLRFAFFCLRSDSDEEPEVLSRPPPIGAAPQLWGQAQFT